MNTHKFLKAGILLALSAAANFSLAQPLDPTPPEPINQPPAVRIITPQNGAVMLPGNISLCALTQSFTDAVAQVQFFAGTTSLGVVTNGNSPWGVPPAGAPELSCLLWSNVTAGAYTLTAQATDLAGIIVTSAPVEITVVTDLPPLVSIVAPRNGATILGPSDITIWAAAFDPDGRVVSVEFFEDGNSLGIVSNTPICWVTNRLGVIPIPRTCYSLTWSNVPTGTYSLTAVATDNEGFSSTSATAEIAVVSNLPPVVKIVEPSNGARLYGPTNIRLSAAARDPHGTVASVEFFNGTTSLGVVSNGIPVTDEREVATLYSLTWSNVPPGAYTLTAVATDNAGVSGTSAPVTITVVVRPPPLVEVVHPRSGAEFVAPANIFIATITRYFANPIASVQFLAGTKVLGTVTNCSWPTFFWKQVPPGSYSLTVVATDTAGTTATSQPVDITVLTNRPSATAGF